MRPRRLELEGFASFRESTVVDFADADLFVLSGPTGAGKSTIIDAITFALYGAVARYDNQALVWPVISQGKNEARVRLDFTAGGESYSAVRVVKRTKTGATTRDAILEEAGGRVRANTADTLTAEVVRLLGLEFQQFTRCVVLPQGEFAEFLHATAGERQQLLVQLLGLDIFQRIARAANQRAVIADAQAVQCQAQLDGPLAAATEAAVAAATARVSGLADLLATIEAARPQIETAAAEHARAQTAAGEAETRARLLEAVAPPPGLDELTRAAAEATASLQNAERALDAATAARENAARDAGALAPAAIEARTALDRHGRRETIARDLRDAAAAAAAAAGEAARAAARLEEAEGALRAAADQLERVRRERAAAHLAEHLVAGKPCPVCLQKVRSLPVREAPADLDHATADRAAAERAVLQARAEAAGGASRNAARQAELDALTASLAALDGELVTLPVPDEARRLLERDAAADQALRAATGAENEARLAQRRAREAGEQARVRTERAWTRFDRTRDGLAALGPPPAARRDLNEDWGALLEWASDRGPAERRAAREQRALAAEAAARLDACAARLAEAILAAGVDPAGRDPRDACADALAAARADADRLVRDHAAAARVRADQARFARAAAVGKELAKLLNANNFERWLMNRALGVLVAGATRVLRELSSGAYSLALDTRNDFLVIDHRNADERRMARTLSGGETFLASLALALALADHVAELAAAGAARLDALFLDEGFGTLDADTLDTVAAAIEELGSRGRMVGLVTHVRELADRMPVRFEVRRTGGVSTVCRIPG